MAQARKGRGQQQPPPPDDDDEGDGEEFTDAQLGRITGIVNAAVSGQLQRKLPRMISDSIATPINELRSLIEGNGGNRGRQRANDDDDDVDDDNEPPAPKRGKGKGRGNTQPDPEKENMRKRLDAIEAERRTEREQNRNRERDGQLREYLTKLGVDPNRVRGAIAVLREATKYDEKNGEWSYVAKREGFDEELDLGAGAAEWVKTDEGKSYLGSTGTTQPRGGSGTRVGGTSPVIGNPGGGGGTRSSGADPKAAKVAAKQDAIKSLNEAVGALAGGQIPLG